MADALPNKLRVQCQTCRKCYGGTLEKLKRKPTCPNCGASGKWWNPVETREIHRARIEARRRQAGYQPPPPPQGVKWVPWQDAPGSYVVARLALAGWVLAPLGLITGPIGIWLAVKNYERATSNEPTGEDVPMGVGIMLNIGAIVASIIAAYIFYLMFTGQWEA